MWGDFGAYNINVSKSVIAKGTMNVNYNLDATQNAVTVANGGLITILENFSGFVVTNNWTGGSCELWVCGSGVVVRIGGVGPGAAVMNFAPAQNGYAIYNNAGATATYGIATIRTRGAA